MRIKFTRDWPQDQEKITAKDGPINYIQHLKLMKAQYEAISKSVRTFSYNTKYMQIEKLKRQVSAGERMLK